MLSFVAPVRAWVLFALTPSLSAAFVRGHVADAQGKPITRAYISSRAATAITADDGGFILDLSDGPCVLEISAPGFRTTRERISVPTSGIPDLNLRLTEIAPRRDAVTVIGASDMSEIQTPDPAGSTWVRDDLLDANPGRPGAPAAIPGLPTETASGGIKAPQYFAPGVAGDHGESVATFCRVGTFLVPNNLSANAHGNGYSDPNAIIPGVIETVEVESGAFNVREGNHAVNVAEVYGFRPRVSPFFSVAGDYHDVDATSGWSPGSQGMHAWVVVEAAYGNGLLDFPEHRRQYKLNGYRVFEIGSHAVTLFGSGYYGESAIPGLVPLDERGLRDTIDPRQRDQTHTAEIAANDVWELGPSSQLQFSGFFRTYNLSLYSNFGGGLIRQSEFRTVTGGNTNYLRRVLPQFSLMAGLDYLRDAPRRLDLDRYDSSDPVFYGPFRKITSNDVTLNFVSPYVAIDGGITRWLHYDLGWRRDQAGIDNSDLLHLENSLRAWTAVNSPKATVSILPPEGMPVPRVSFSIGQTFFTNDPRIGSGRDGGTMVSRAHSAQLVFSRTVAGTDLRVTFGRTTQEQSLAKIDPDTGLQYNEGPSRNRFVTFSARRYFGSGMVAVSVSKADARDLSAGTPLPEAPRFIFDLLGGYEQLPFHLYIRGEYEQVGRKPLGDGFAGVPVREFRGAVGRGFHEGRIEAGIHFMLAGGYTGQTTEVVALPGETDSMERVVGVRIRSYISASFAYHFRPRSAR